MAVDLGSRTTKAVLLERRGEVLALTRYTLLDAPIYEKKMSPEMLADHLRQVSEALGNTTKSLTLTVGLDDVIVRQVELPQIPMDEMRLVLKNNAKGYLQQDLPNHVFDCYVFPPKAPAGNKPAEAPKPAGIPKLKVLVAAAKQQLVGDFQAAAKNAGLTLDCLAPGLTSPVNAFELAMAKEFADEVVALVDVGFKHSSICVLDHGVYLLLFIRPKPATHCTDFAPEWITREVNMIAAFDKKEAQDPCLALCGVCCGGGPLTLGGRLSLTRSFRC